MNSRRTVKVRDLLHDLRSGISDSDLMSKYDLSVRQLKEVFSRLVEIHAATSSELYKLSPVYKHSVDGYRPRRAPRVEMTMPVWIRDIERSRQCLVRDLSVLGLRVVGNYSQGENADFELPIDMWMPGAPIRFLAECVWSELKGKKTSYRVAGFKIKEISREDRRNLSKFLGMTLLNSSGHWKTGERTENVS